MSSVHEDISEFQEFDTRGAQSQGSVRLNRIVESARLALTVLALLAGITILSTAANTLSVYNTTHLSEDFLLPLWPNDFDLRPTTALVICGAIISVASIVALAVTRIPSIRNQVLVHRFLSFLAPTVGLIAALIATSFFYGVNASNTTSTIKSWTCQWSSVSMTSKPHWGSLCLESKAALYLTVMIIPLEVFVLGTVTWAFVAEKKQQPTVVHERKGSPTMS